jgi:superfamily I DNA/RNA helicase/RecB family exonuclease
VPGVDWEGGDGAPAMRTITAAQAAGHLGSPLLVLGGPGTGKTTFLENRFLRLAGTVAPHRVLLLCGSRRYAVEARERLSRALPQQALVEVPVYTWHALAWHLVARHYPLLGYRQMPVLLTGTEQWGTVRELLDGENPADWPEWGSRLPDRAFADEVADFCLRARQLRSPDELAGLEGVRPDWSEVIRFYGRYRELLKASSRLDYAELIAAAVRLVAEQEDVRNALADRFQHVLVDDGQDLSLLHVELLRRLENLNLVVAADPDTGVETFRGAVPDWVFGFESHFGPSACTVLGDGRRLGEPLAAAARQLIRRNEPESAHRLSDPAPHSTSFECRIYRSAAQEVEAIARRLRSLHLVDRVAWSDMAVLLSQPRFLLAPLERALEQYEVPYRPMGGDRPLPSDPAVRCFLDLVRVALRIGNTERLTSEVLTGPVIGLDLVTRRRLEREAWRDRQSLESVVARAPETAELRRLVALVVRHQGRADECFWQVYSTASYYRALEAEALADPESPANATVDSLVALSNSLGRFVQRRGGEASVEQYLNEAARADFGADPWLAPGAGSSGVEILTYHSAKGREWDTVIVAGCLDIWIPKGRRAQGLFDPHSLQTPQVSQRELEAISEDRRTFFLAATRARSRVIFTVSPSAGGRARPSRFLYELAGTGPEVQAAGELMPVTTAELKAQLRRILASDQSSPGARAAALLALSDVPGTDPLKWYGHLPWTDGDTSLVDERGLRTSYSRLGVFENCGLQYLLQSVLGLDAVSTYSMKFGTWIHHLFQAAHEGRITDATSLLTEYDRFFDESIFPNTTISRQFRRDGEKMLRVFWEHEAGAKPVKAEHAFEFQHAGALLRGRIDRVDKIGKTLKLTDYKTAKWTPSSLQARKSLQLAIYHLAARVDPELSELGKPEVARLVYPGAFWPDGRYKELSQTADQADEVLEKLPEMIAGVAAEEFNPTPDADCYFCKMKPLCPLWPEGREVMP